MGSIFEINDTLQLTREQGFPAELEYETHYTKPYTTESFSGRIFEFKGKPGIRIYQAPPVRNFLVENREGKWIYWGLIHVLDVHHDYTASTTSGTFRITHLYTPEEMKIAHNLIDRNCSTIPSFEPGKSF